VNGPRSCTDILFLIAFIAFWVGMVVCAAMGFSKGDISRLLYFVDYNGNRCGDGDLADYKYTHFTHWLHAGSNVCVRECPSTAYMKYTLVQNATVGNTNIGYTASQSDLTNCLIDTNLFANCLKDSVTASVSTLISSYPSCCTYSAAPAPDGLYICLPVSINSTSASYAQEYLDQASQMLNAATGDLVVGWWIMLVSAFVALIMSFIWSYILKYSAACFVYSCVALSNLTLIIATGLSYYMYDKYSKAYDDNGLAGDQQMMYIMLLALIVSGIACLVLLCMTICLCKQIRIAVGIIEAACEAVQQMPLIVFFPLVSYFVMLVFILYWVIVAAYMASSGDYVRDDLTGVYTMEFEEDMQKAMLYHFFGLLWNMAFIRHMTILILAGAFGTWYWTSQEDKKAGNFYPRPILGSVWRSIFYHTGTVAFGSFIIAVLQMIQYVLEYIKKKQDSEYLKCIISYIQCLVKCFERLMEKLSQLAYIVTACKGNMFCTAAWESFGFLWRHMGQQVVVTWISAFLMILGKLFIVCTTVGIGFLLAGTNEDLSSPYILLICVAIIAYIVACLFLGVFDNGIDVILVCFCWEKDANGAMVNAENERTLYGTPGLTKFIEGAKAVADEMKAKANQPEASAPGGTTEVQPAVQTEAS